MKYSILLITCAFSLLGGMEKHPSSPSPGKPAEQFSMQDYATFCALQQIITRILNSSLVETSQDYNEISINPYEHQTQQGLFLCLYEYFPHAILTPWGLCTFAIFYCYKDKNNSWKDMHKYLERTIEIEHFKDNIIDNHGHTIGPIYKIKKVGNTILPEPKKRKRLILPNDARYVWNAMYIKHNNERKLIRQKSEQETENEIQKWEDLVNIVEHKQASTSSSSYALLEQITWERILDNI